MSSATLATAVTAMVGGAPELQTAPAAISATTATTSGVEPPASSATVPAAASVSSTFCASPAMGPPAEMPAMYAVCGTVAPAVRAAIAAVAPHSAEVPSP